MTIPLALIRSRKKIPLFRYVKPGTTAVLTEADSLYVGDFIYKMGGARGSKALTPFLIVCVDTGGDPLGQSRCGEPRDLCHLLLIL